MQTEYDTVVLGGTPGGIATAVRAAREGAETLLVTYNDHLGGMMTGGLSYTDTLMMKPRAKIFAEFRAAVREHYRDTFGPDSEDYAACEAGYIFEPHVAESVLDGLVEGETSLDLRWGYSLQSVERENREITSLTLQAFDSDETVTIAASVFADATYEGDLLATAGAEFRVGRESRSEFNEQFAGKLYTRTRGDRYYPQEAVGEGVNPDAPADRRGPLDTPPEKRQGPLDLVPHPAGISEIYPRSTGQGDDRIQAYSYRLCLTDDPENRVKPSMPDDYDPAEYTDSLEEIERVGFRAFMRLRYLPNDKADMNTADLPGENYDYPDADWEGREEIAQRHKSHILGLLYFLQNDDAVPDKVQSEANQWGLAADEFEDNDNFPFQLYVREARRLDGRYMFTENDARYADGLDRTPVHRDSIAVAEYPLDSHACQPDRQFGSHPEGHFYASQVTRPAHVPYRALLPQSIDNLLVPVPLSASHVGYGSLRLEPTWLHIGESAGYAAAIAVESDQDPADISVARLQRRLAENEMMLSFFNDVDVTDEEPWVPAVQYLGTRGFFGSYDAEPEEPLSRGVAEEWAATTADLLGDAPDELTDHARALQTGDESGSVTAEEFVAMLEHELSVNVPSTVDTVLEETDSVIDRGTACRLVYRLLRDRDS
ncbi:FAD-dependent oxidoreductase [Haloarcula laminariae]|uniref:FAD-dependent oxidoreductase n=1 Tax=Haloarcula laminariae TaxID=2961577 RepID=UPI0021C98DE6|nr:FAD-dependent oxidoreductase [Halomicroarcula laminariae]